MKNAIPYPRLPGNSLKFPGRHSRYINVLSRMAADITSPVGGNARLAACVVYKNDIVSFGLNEKKSHPFQAKYGKNSDAVYLHAETSAIKNALKYLSVEELADSSLYVCRVKFYDQNKKKLIFG